jgi:ABC-type Fe3+-hydroxamate transport system substrate-binding protein
MTARRALLLAVVAVLLAACGNSAPPASAPAEVSVVDVRGQRVEFAAPPQRVVLTTYRQVLDGYDFESIAALRPDAIVTVPDDDAANNRLAEIAPLVVVDGQLDFVGTRLQMLGPMLGRTDRATELSATMTDGLDQVSRGDRTSR